MAVPRPHAIVRRGKAYTALAIVVEGFVEHVKFARIQVSHNAVRASTLAIESAGVAASEHAALLLPPAAVSERHVVVAASLAEQSQQC